ncbi:MAG: hypothetical protein ACD_19C00033G0001, partial [uncultured bacterium]
MAFTNGFKGIERENTKIIIPANTTKTGKFTR